MSKPIENLSIMFADITGSTKLYDSYGNEIAEAIVSKSLDIVQKIVKEHDGTIIKTIGDEVMCSFIKPENALDTSSEIHNHFCDNEVLDKYTVSFRIGIHYGEALESNNDIYGDAVNVASRLTSIARSGQTIFSEDLFTNIDVEHQNNARKYDVTNIKGKDSKITIYELLWEDDSEEELTRISGSVTSVIDVSDTHASFYELSLKYLDKTILEIGGEQSLITIGRSLDNTLPVISGMASRAHSRIFFRRGKFVLSDQSTNGTTVLNNNTNPIFLKREEIPLVDNGTIVFGQIKPENNDQDIIVFEINLKQNKF